MKPPEYVIKLNDGNPIKLMRIYSARTYEGLICGIPTDILNRRFIHDNMKKAASLFEGYPVVTVDPKRTKILEDESFGDVDPCMGIPERLPEIVCMAVFDSSFPAKDKTKDWAGLGIVWYQDEFPFPISDDALNAIKTIRWSKIASDFTY